MRLEDIDVDTLVRDADVPLATLSDEQFQALWAGERLQLEPEAESMLFPALKSLVAAGLAQLTESGDIELLHDAALIREARTRLATSLVWRRLDEHQNPPVLETWSLLTRHTVLEQRWEPPGVHRFTLCDLRRAVDELIATLVPAGSSFGPWPYSGDDLIGRVRAELPRIARVDVLTPTPLTGDGEMEPTASSLTLAADDGRCVMLTPHPDGTAVMMVSRADVRRELLQLLMAGTSVPAVEEVARTGRP